MKRIDVWLARASARAAGQPRLEDALLGRRPLRYVAHRLRWITLRVLLRTVLHVIEVVALTRVFSFAHLGPILFLRHGTSVVSSLWWGALEAQRNSLRAARRTRDAVQFADCSGTWLGLALVAITCQQLGVAAFLCLMPRRYSGFSIYDAYAIACGLRLALDTWSRTRHSIVFSVARVRRPLASMVLVDLVEVFGLLVAWLQVGAFAFAIMLVVSGGLRAAFTIRFTDAARRQLNLPDPLRSAWRELVRGSWSRLPVRDAAKFALLNTALQLDSLAILALTAGAGGRRGLLLSITLHALAPLFGAGFAWTRVFYFDFIRLGSYVCPLFTARFGHLLDRVAIVYPVVLAMLVLPVVRELAPGLLVSTPILLGVVVVARSLFALRQMEAYSYADHRVQIRQGLVLLLTLGLVLLPFAQTHFVLLGIAAALASAALIGRRAHATRPDPETGEALCPEAFIGWLAQVTQPLHLMRIVFDRNMLTFTKLRAALVDGGYTAPCLQWNSGEVLMAALGSHDISVLRRGVIVATAGTARIVSLGPSARNGLVACASIQAELLENLGFQDRQRAGAKATDPDCNIDALACEFHRLFPDGVHLTGTSGIVASFGMTTGGEFRRILSDVSTPKPIRSRSADKLAIAVFRPNGETLQLFLVPRRESQLAEFVAFRRKVVRASICATLRDIGTRAAPV